MRVNARSPGLESFRTRLARFHSPIGNSENWTLGEAETFESNQRDINSAAAFATGYATMVQNQNNAAAPMVSQDIVNALAQEHAQQQALIDAQNAQMRAQQQAAIDQANAAIAKANAQAQAARTAAEAATAKAAQDKAQQQAAVIAAVTGGSVESQLDLSTGGNVIGQPAPAGASVISMGGILSDPRILIGGGILAYLLLRR